MPLWLDVPSSASAPAASTCPQACITEFSSAEAGGGDVTEDRLYEELERVSEHRTIIKGHVRASGWLRWLWYVVVMRA